MCQYLDPASFMVNVFADCPERDALSLSLLREVRDHVNETLAAHNVVIEWTRDAVMGALENYPDVLAYRGQSVVWKGNLDRDSVRRCFSSGLEATFISALSKAIQEGPAHGSDSMPACSVR